MRISISSLSRESCWPLSRESRACQASVVDGSQFPSASSGSPRSNTDFISIVHCPMHLRTLSDSIFLSNRGVKIQSVAWPSHPVLLPRSASLCRPEVCDVQLWCGAFGRCLLAKGCEHLHGLPAGTHEREKLAPKFLNDVCLACIVRRDRKVLVRSWRTFPKVACAHKSSCE